MGLCCRFDDNGVGSVALAQGFASLDEMVRDPVSPSLGDRLSGRRFGLGIVVQDIDGVRLEDHAGGANGYISDFERFPEQDAMMIALGSVWIFV